MTKASHIDAASAPIGMVGLWIDPQGRVIANAADFHRDRPGGYRVQEAQEYRVRKALYRRMVDAYCSSVIADAVDEYAVDVIARNLLDKGHKVVFVPIGEEPTP